MLRAGIVGASGYTGAELLRLLAGHPEIDVVLATGDSQAGMRAADLYPSLANAYPKLTFEPLDVDRTAGLDVVFCGLPHQASMDLVPRLVGKVGCVVDLSAAFRLKDTSHYPQWYGFEHDEPELLAEAVYGLARAPPGAARRRPPHCHPGLLRHGGDPRPGPAPRRRGWSAPTA